MTSKFLKLTKNSAFLWSAMFFLGFIYLMVGIGHESLWFDESYSAAITNYSIPDIISIAAYDSHPPLYYVMLKIITMIFGRSELSLRLLSVIGALALASLGIGPVRRIYGKFAGSVFSLIVLTTPMTLAMGQEARMYTLAAFFVTGCILYGYLGAKENKVWDWFRFSLFTLASAYTHYFALLAVTIANVLLFIWILIRDRNKLKQYIITTLGTLIVFSPWIVTLYNQASITAKEFWIPSVDINVILGALIFPYREKFDNTPLAYFSFVGAIIMIIWGMIAAIKKREDTKLPSFAILTYALTLTSAIVLSKVIRPIFVERYIFPSVGLLLLVLAYAITRVNKKKLAIIILAVFILLSVPQILRVYSERFNGPMKEVVASIKDDIKKEDVFVHTSVHTYGTFSYYFPNNKHVYYLPVDIVNNRGNDAFNKNGTVITDINEAVKDLDNLWLVDQVGGTGSSELYGWYASGLFKAKKAPSLYKIPTSWFEVIVTSAEKGIVKDETVIPEGKGNIKIKVGDIRDNTGKLVLRLFKTCDLLFTLSGEFEDSKVIEMKTVDINSSDVEVVFENIPYGFYAGFALQDVNNSSQLEYVGNYIPKEGIGMTNGMDKFMNGGIPTFEVGKFLLDKEELEVKLDMVYFD